MPRHKTVFFWLENGKINAKTPLNMFERENMEVSELNIFQVQGNVGFGTLEIAGTYSSSTESTWLQICNSLEFSMESEIKSKKSMEFNIFGPSRFS